MALLRRHRIENSLKATRNNAIKAKQLVLSLREQGTTGSQKTKKKPNSNGKRINIIEK